MARQNLNSIAYFKKWFGVIFNEIVAIEHGIFWNLQTFLELLIKFYSISWGKCIRKYHETMP